MRKCALLFSLSCLLMMELPAQVLPLREQARVIDELLGERLDSLLPSLMQKNEVDMWVVVSREYNEDPVLKTMLPATWLSARRRTILVFYNNPAKKQYEKIAIARYDVGDHIRAGWDMQRFPNQWDALLEIITRLNPRNIALDYSTSFAHADGLDHTEYTELISKLPGAFKSRVVSAEKLAIAWLETRTAREMEIYPRLVDITHRIIEEGFSDRVITAGITSTEDLVWWFRQKIRDMGLDTWFHPSVSIQRDDSTRFDHLASFSKSTGEDIIREGDLLHVDIGITYLRLNTDIQEHAYVLRHGETALPTSLQKAFASANRLQEILTGQFKEGKTGNQILHDALAQANQEGIHPSIYTHPLGYHGHAAGPTIGLWDQQQGVPGAGDFPVHNHTVYSIELNAASRIPEWNKEVRMMLEEDGYFDEKGFRFISGRQKEVYVIPRLPSNIFIQ